MSCLRSLLVACLKSLCHRWNSYEVASATEAFPDTWHKISHLLFLDCCLCCFLTVPLCDQGALFVYRLHSSFSLFSFETCNYCNRMVLRNKKPHFPPTQGKYLAIVLEENNKKTIRAQKTAPRVFLHLHKDLCSQAHSMQTWNTTHSLESHATDSHMRSVNQRTVPGTADPFCAFSRD